MTMVTGRNAHRAAVATLLRARPTLIERLRDKRAPPALGDTIAIDNLCRTEERAQLLDGVGHWLSSFNRR